MNTALVLIDIQNDYFKDGKNVLVGAEEAAEHARRALSLFREKRWPVFHVQHVSLQENAAFFLPGTDGVKFHQQVFPQDGEKIVVKHAPDSFFKTELRACLESANIKRLVFCGMMSHMCVDTSVRAAKPLGYDVLLLNDACATKDLTWNDAVIPAQTVHNAFMASLQGTFARVVNSMDLPGLL